MRTVSHTLLKTTSVSSLVVLLAFLVLPAFAETKAILSEATYIMGDGETPTGAEAMALQKAKQMALEQAGTYVESFTKIKNYTLTTEEIQTIAGGVLQVEVLEKRRELISDGLRLYVKIKAIVTTDKIADLAQRIKGKGVGEDYKKLQEEFSRLSKEIETWKQLVAKTPAGPEREAALNQIRKQEKGFAIAQKNEAAFYQRLVSGEELHSKALASQSKKQSEKVVIDALFRKILEQGHIISVGEPEITATLKDPSQADISVTVTLRISETIRAEIEETAHSLGGEVRKIDTSLDNAEREGQAIRISKDIEFLEYFQKRISNLVFALEFSRENKQSVGCFLPTLISDHPVKSDRFLLGSILPGEMRGNYLETGVSSFDTAFDVGQGFVAALKYPTTFTARTRIPIKIAQTIKTVRGRFIEDTEPNSEAVNGMHQCQLINASHEVPERKTGKIRLRDIERPAEAPRLRDYGTASGQVPQTKAPMVLVLEASELSWVAIKVDDASPSEALLHPGERKTWEAQDRFELTIGNAGSIRGELNGKPLESFGPKGKIVRDLVLTR